MSKILFFASLREQLGMEELEFPLASSQTISDLVENLVSAHPELALLQDEKWLVAVNQVMSGRDMPVREGDEVAFFPPVTGG